MTDSGSWRSLNRVFPVASLKRNVGQQRTAFITNTVPLTNIDQDEIKAVLSEYKLSNADVVIRHPNASADDLVDVIEGNR